MRADPDSFPTYAELTQTQAWAGGAPPPIAPLEEPARPIGPRYTERAVIGVGGMGKVVLAGDARVGREVAMKQIRADRDVSPEERSRFLREARVQGQLEHPSIVPVYDIDYRPDGGTFFTMRRVLGRTLHAILDDLRAGAPEATARHTQRELLQAFATVCLAVDYAHSRGVIHRDLKPENIMLGDFGEVYVLDWGLALIVEPAPPDGEPSQRLSAPGSTLGTPQYMAPEQLDDPNVAATADVFALGAVLFEILTLQRLRTTLDVEAAVDARASIRAPDKAVALELELMCVRATQRDPGERFPSARALQEALARYLEGDRELAQRRELAQGHAARARAAIGRAADPGADHERDTGIAIGELARAIALEPGNTEHVAMFAEIMAAPVRATPPQVHARIEDAQQAVVRAGARHAAYASLAWIMFVPLVFALGLRRPELIAWIAVPIVAAAALAAIAARQHPIRRPIQCAALVVMVIGTVATSRLFGSLILVPTLVAVWALVMQTHPEPAMRRFGLAISLVAIALPIVLEMLGAVPSAYVFEGGNLIVTPQLVEFPPLLTFGFLALANVTATLMPSLYIARLRAELSHAQERELVQAWQFRRLAAELLRATERER